MIQTRRWENLLDFSTVFSGWFTPAVERACERTVSPRYLTRGAQKTRDKMVRDRLAQFYREVLQDETYSAVLPDAILREAEAGVLSSHSVENMLLFPPVILITNASYTTVQRALKLLDHFADLRSYPSDAGSDLEQLSKRSPVDDLSSREEPRREPLSFGAAVGAVILGLIVTVLLLSFL